MLDVGGLVIASFREQRVGIDGWLPGVGFEMKMVAAGVPAAADVSDHVARGDGATRALPTVEVCVVEPLTARGHQPDCVPAEIAALELCLPATHGDDRGSAFGDHIDALMAATARSCIPPIIDEFVATTDRTRVERRSLDDLSRGRRVSARGTHWDQHETRDRETDERAEGLRCVHRHFCMLRNHDEKGSRK